MSIRSKQSSFLVQEDVQIMSDGRLKGTRIELFGQHAERLRVVSEIVDAEDGLWVRQIILLQIVVETRARSTEIWNASSD